jgi:hypothetical protein
MVRSMDTNGGVGDARQEAAPRNRAELPVFEGGARPGVDVANLAVISDLMDVEDVGRWMPTSPLS